jgi:hypothetical protein
MDIVLGKRHLLNPSFLARSLKARWLPLVVVEQARQDRSNEFGTWYLWIATRSKAVKPATKIRTSEYSGLRHIVSVSKRPDGLCEYEERLGEAPPNQSRVNHENVMTIFFGRARETGTA